MRYQRKVDKMLWKTFPGVKLCPWFAFQNFGGKARFCQPDALWEQGGDVLCLEIKVRFGPDAFWQLLDLYRPVVTRALGRSPLLGIICKHFDPYISVPREFALVEELTMDAFAAGCAEGGGLRMAPVKQLTPEEMIHLCAVDNDFFCHTFFPEAFRSSSPPYAARLDRALNDPKIRLLNARVFRGGAKTTLLRAFAAKRIAFGTSRTILYIGASEGHATRSVQWLRGKIEPKLGGDGVYRATPFAHTFGLKPGKKWQEHEIEIVQSVPKRDGTTEERNFWVMGVGITGSIRGINFDDYRPDLIILDDVITDESASTAPQRDKLADLIMGAIKNSLAPATEEPNAKLVMLQTPLD